jgi:tRNA 2-thiocytidine biosynthesis protein TtcA
MNQSAPGATSVAIKKLEKRLRREAGRAIGDHRMIEEGDRVMVCLSGGKDSYTMLDILLALQAAAPVSFTLEAVNLDQKQPHFPADVLPAWARERGVRLHVLEQDTYSVVKRVVPEGRTMCGLCSRLRRGALYRFARENGFTRIALGHHRDDIMETLFLNLFNGGRMAAMPPKLLSEDGECTVIRPLAYCAERDIAKYAVARAYPIIPCRLCGSQENSQRRAVKGMLREWERDHPGRLDSIFRALQTVVPSHLLDRDLFDFASLGSASAAAGGDDGGEAAGAARVPAPDVPAPDRAREAAAWLHLRPAGYSAAAPASNAGRKVERPASAGSGAVTSATGTDASRPA